MALALITRALPALSGEGRRQFMAAASKYGVQLSADVARWGGQLTTAVRNNKVLSALLVSDLYQVASAVGDVLPFSDDELVQALSDLPSHIRERRKLTDDDIKRIATVTGDHEYGTIDGQPISESVGAFEKIRQQRENIDAACRAIGSPRAYHNLWSTLFNVDAEVHVAYMRELGVIS